MNEERDWRALYLAGRICEVPVGTPPNLSIARVIVPEGFTRSDAERVARTIVAWALPDDLTPSAEPSQ
jgi:hypothetical protein